MHRFKAGKRWIAVCFTEDRAVAVHIPLTLHPARVMRDRDVLMVFGLTATREAPRLLVGDTGWVLATETCPLRHVRAAATP